MKLNPIEEIRANRAELMRKFDYDIDKLAYYLDEKYKSSEFHFVESKPQRTKRASKKHKETAGPSAKRKTSARPSNRNPKRKKSA